MNGYIPLFLALSLVLPPAAAYRNSSQVEIASEKLQTTIRDIKKAEKEYEKAKKKLQNTPDRYDNNPASTQYARAKEKANEISRNAKNAADALELLLPSSSSKQHHRNLIGQAREAAQAILGLIEETPPGNSHTANDSNSESPPLAVDSISVETCLNGLNVDIGMHGDIPAFCQSFRSRLNHKSFDLEITRKENGDCQASPKWWRINLKNQAVLECLGLTFKGKDNNTIDTDLPFELSSPDEKISLYFNEKKIKEKNCPRELDLKKLEIKLNEEEDEEDEEEDEEDEEDEQDAPKRLKKYHNCDWSISYDGAVHAIKESGDELSIEGLDGFEVSIDVENQDECVTRNGGYSCSQEIDDSSHEITLTVSKENQTESKTCKIPSREELRQEEGGYPLLPVKPFIPPKPIRFNFERPIMSPGVL